MNYKEAWIQLKNKLASTQIYMNGCWLNYKNETEAGYMGMKLQGIDLAVDTMKQIESSIEEEPN